MHAVLVRHPGQGISLDDVRTHTRGLIAGNKIPRSIDIVDELPVSTARKILKTDLCRTAGDPENSRPTTTA